MLATCSLHRGSRTWCAAQIELDNRAGSEGSGEQCQRRTAASCTVGATLQIRLPRRVAPWFATLTDAVRPSPAQKAKYKAHEFGSCPRTLCEKQTVLPTGVSDTASLR